MVSVTPPAGTGTISLTPALGKFCETAGADAASATTAIAVATVKADRTLMATGCIDPPL